MCREGEKVIAQGMPGLLSSERAGVPPTALLQTLGSTARTTEAAASKELHKVQLKRVQVKTTGVFLKQRLGHIIVLCSHSTVLHLSEQLWVTCSQGSVGHRHL